MSKNKRKMAEEIIVETMSNEDWQTKLNEWSGEYAINVVSSSSLYKAKEGILTTLVVARISKAELAKQQEIARQAQVAAMNAQQKNAGANKPPIIGRT